MCTENYWTNIVETHPDLPDPWWVAHCEKDKLRIGLKGDVPEWLIFKMAFSPQLKTERRYDRLRVRSALRLALQKAIAHGKDWDDFSMETRTSRLGNKRDWF